MDIDDDLSSDHYGLPHSERSRFVKGLNEVISSLVAMLKSFRLKEHADTLDVTVRTLLDMTRLEGCVKPDNGTTSLSQNAYAALRELCSNSHGTVIFTIMLITQYMLPRLLYHHANSQPKSAIVVHEASICFLKSLLKSHEKEAVPGIVTLIHQLMIQCPERLEGRQKQAAVLIKLLNVCNRGVFTIIFKDLIAFCYNSKISCRLFAQEIVGKLLTEPSLSNHLDLDEDTRMKIRRTLVAVVSSRCMDRSPLVRGKAMATLASFSDCHDDADKSILESVLDGSAPSKALPTFDDLKRALSEDTDPLPGSDTFVTMLLDRVYDERALVRRSALKILRNLSVIFPPFANKTTRVISDRCRDPTLIVRQFAVHVLSEILERFPHDSDLLDEWMRAVVPQIYDIEAKVQEKVLECLQSLVIGRITSASTYVPDAAGALPWRILNRLSEMRMRKHLSKACSLWARNGVISKSVISNLQSHIGTDNTVAAWILLAALTENTKIPDIDKYIADYKQVIQKNDFHASLVLQVLRNTWSVLDSAYLEDLHRHLYRCVRLFEINFNLVSICLDIVYGVLRHLHAADRSNQVIELKMVELMRASEAQIQDLFREDEEDCAQDSTLKMRAIFTLGHASLFCTSRVSWSTLRGLERLLEHWESLPESVREMKDLQAAVVIVLCQQALRDREVAKEVTPIFGNLMRQETSSDEPRSTAVKINAAKALADICVRFTALVEPYLPDMCISMKDSNPAVRETIVVIFIQLLLEDFIKMKGPFFFHILTMLSDANSDIRELTIFLVEERLLAKNKNLISQQFLESIFHYNNYQSQGRFCGHRMHEREKKLLTLPGRANAAKRNVIYEFMLEHLDASAKLELMVKLTKYILREICDSDSVDVTVDEGACVLRDTVFILGNSRLQVSSLSCEKHRDDVPELDETISPSAPSNNERAAMNALVATMKKHHLDNLLPTLIPLKKKLAALKSSLEDDVESLLFKIYSEYEKEHLLSLLNEYPELEKEMDHYQRRSKDKILETDDGTRSPSTDKDSLQELRKRPTPRVLLHRLSPSALSGKNVGSVPNDRAIDSSNHLQITGPYDTFVKSPSVRLERLLLTPTPPPEPSDINTPTSTKRNLDESCLNDSRHRITRTKRPASEEVFPDARKRLQEQREPTAIPIDDGTNAVG
ncbi:Condensin-2 complex subunit D3 [Ooceraea biroi]|uniref:Condensin-2 complex subunit D3 n=1 Tax=Ooceraea biroi TaxID=2015173 RepID=A0A026X158_OOCBI|nr:Condensin-2 complex subunit D3 [Ooceraea biroi]